MAFKINRQIDVFGELATLNCYTVIVNIRGGKDFLALEVEDQRFDNREIKIDSKEYWFTPSVKDGSENFIKQGYEHLKTLDEFEGAVDY
ncbi:hypothetical protein [Jeotgalibacillus campisalis]|uniref:Uncharacterized protein n=1 Tax=Jeotgalibacillus campisalis TaxID=220754 RepID=A0A0C2VB41_9BACL|nr:hypothetical protein [Jeotgalibacillus campisalis]KIL46147.1 hypothetical protein KR50_28220 [Jeotgalibacillus campisalis]